MLNVSNFNPIFFVHHIVRGYENCLLNACAKALLSTENKVALLRDSIVRFVQDCSPNLLLMHSTQSEPHNLTMEILDNTTNEESMDHVRTE